MRLEFLLGDVLCLVVLAYGAVASQNIVRHGFDTDLVLD
jgi:hypothetical protein